MTAHVPSASERAIARSESLTDIYRNLMLAFMFVCFAVAVILGYLVVHATNQEKNDTNRLRQLTDRNHSLGVENQRLIETNNDQLAQLNSILRTLNVKIPPLTTPRTG